MDVVAVKEEFQDVPQLIKSLLPCTAQEERPFIMGRLWKKLLQVHKNILYVLKVLP